MAIANAPTSSGQSLQLHDIHIPEQISNYPIAPGWWILLAIMVVSVLWVYKAIKKNRRLNLSKKQALVVLEKNPTLSAIECISLLKWTAIQYFNRQQLAKLYGPNFQHFLMMQLPEKHQTSFIKLTTDAFKQQYQAIPTAVTSITDVDKDCQQATKLWLIYALPVKSFATIDIPLALDETTVQHNKKGLSV